MIKKILIKKKRLKKIAKNLHPSDKMILVVMWMRLLGQFETSSLFFYEKILSEQKAPNHKSIKAQKAQIANKRTKTRKAAILCAWKTSKGKRSLVYVFVLFLCSKSFCKKKKIKKLEISLIASLTLLLMLNSDWQF